ncbi:hypothetical protein P43SY_009618 [Pythium insidiosum]|uniref:PHD-type domain-containing protein n=1 Tax=Pythium insidiosum TaxID=114742 RepID=A0AAD5QCY8_PYTIN|nr:hypothetical protein P43SY_009618 [Pythium insidiosum]
MNSRRTANGAKPAGGAASAAGLAAAAAESPSKSPANSGKDGGSAAAPANVQFLPLRSRIGKRFQAVLPELRPKPAPPTSRALDGADLCGRAVATSQQEDSRDGEEEEEEVRRRRADERGGVALECRDVMHLAKPRYSIDRANALGSDLDKYLKLARSLRDGATWDTDEQVTSLALQHLHRFDYQPTDAACSLYARHSIQLPRTAASPGPDAETQWLAAFYALLRRPVVRQREFDEMTRLLATASAMGLAATELGVLERLVTRLTTWLTACEDVRDKCVDRLELQQLVYEAEDLTLDVDERRALETRLGSFDAAYSRLKDALERSSRRNQSKCGLDELEDRFAETMALNVDFPEKAEFTETLSKARELKATISTMLAEDKVSLAAMRDVLARIELVPVNFDAEVELFQAKMSSAQSWLAKVRKCIPKRRTSSRRGGNGPEPKKMDLDEIRALVEDAPCGDSVEMFEMQDLLECADEWAVKVRRAIDGGADVTLEELKELLEEGSEMPVEMDEQTYLQAEIGAREWCAAATAMLAARKPFKDMEAMAERAKEIRKQLPGKRQTRWKPQIERDIHAALDAARRWVNEVRDLLSPAAGDKLFSEAATSTTTAATTDKDEAATRAFARGKKTTEYALKLLEKAERFVVDVKAYTTRIEEALAQTQSAREETMTMLAQIGVAPPKPSPAQVAAPMEIETCNASTPAIDPPPPAPSVTGTGNFSQACSLLDRIASLPLIFDEALTLHDIVHSERGWALRVRDALPPRQSRKKRQAKQVITLEQLQALVLESTQLRFQFPDELKILHKELDDLGAWQLKARDVIESQVAHVVDDVAQRLMDYDLIVFARVRDAKRRIGGALRSAAKDAAETENDDAVKSEETLAIKSQETHEKKDVEMVDAALTGSAVDAATPEAKSESTTDAAPVPVEMEPIQVDVILETIRRETGCAKKAGEEADTDSQQKAAVARGIAVLDPLAASVDDTLAQLGQLEVRDDNKRRAMEETMAVAADQAARDGVALPVGMPDEAVKQLDSWREQIHSVYEEGNLFNATAPEMHALSTIMELLEWLQSARSIFFDEPLPLNELVMKGQSLKSALIEFKHAKTTLSLSTVEALERLLWPLSPLMEHDEIVQSWRSRVIKCMDDKHAPMEEVQALMDDAAGLLLEAEAFKAILDEVKKAKLWLTKLKKRLKTLMTKNVSRLTLPVARSLVEEGEEIALELPPFELLKEHVDTAVDWEKRVQDSGLETGQARIANLLALLDEYDRARLVIDLDMHRDVLVSATERYCVCRQPYDGFMIGCDHCDDWFHDNCIGLSKEKAEKADGYTCPSCNVLQDLSTTLHRVATAQDKLWADVDYAKHYEKQHGAATRKVKREEKALERSEMLLVSCKNHLHQLRARIDDIERAKACFTIKAPFSYAASTAASATTATAEAVASSSAASITTSSSPSLQVTLSTTNIPAVAMDTLAFVQRYPNILLPSAKSVVAAQASAASTPAAGGSEASPTIVRPADPLAPAAAANASVEKAAETGASPSCAVAATPLSASNTTAESASTTASSSGPKPVATAAATAAAATTAADGMPNMLAPMLAKLSENTERLSALLVAGGVEQQLAKMKAEFVEVQTQVQEIEATIVVGKERLSASQSALEELKRGFVIRQHGLPRAKAWVLRVIRLLNAPSSLRRASFGSGFLSSAFTDALLDAKAMEIDHFPEVRTYAHLLRVVGWSLVVVALLQERPSREAFIEAIAYATEHSVCEVGKTIAPLHTIIGRMDQWIAKAHKTLSKPSTVAQKAARLKTLLNEYSKLPLTCGWISTLEQFVQLAERSPDRELPVEELRRRQIEAESAVLDVLATASTAGACNATPKVPRKRKSYTKRDKAAAAGGGGETPEKAAKKAKKGAKMNGTSGVAAEADDAAAKALALMLNAPAPDVEMPLAPGESESG